MRAHALALVVAACAAIGAAAAAPDEEPGSIHDCLGLLPAGNIYSLTITLTVDATKQPPIYSARTDLDATRNMGMAEEQAAARFQDCANRFVAG